MDYLKNISFFFNQTINLTKIESKRKTDTFIYVCIFLLGLILFKYQLVDSLQTEISQSVEYRIGQQLSQLVKPGELVFVSGSTTFWLNAFFDISQVRGGNDRGSVYSDWRSAAWEIREGQSPEKSLEALKRLEVDWLVVHSSASAEYYHDYSYPDKFKRISALEKVFNQAGDQIYRVKSQD